MSGPSTDTPSSLAGVPPSSSSSPSGSSPGPSSSGGEPTPPGAGIPGVPGGAVANLVTFIQMQVAEAVKMASTPAPTPPTSHSTPTSDPPPSSGAPSFATGQFNSLAISRLATPIGRCLDFLAPFMCYCIRM